MNHSLVRRSLAAITIIATVALTSACSIWPWNNDNGTNAVSVFDLAVGDCTLTPEEVTVEITQVNRVDCTTEHQQEVFAIVPVTARCAGHHRSESWVLCAVPNLMIGGY